MARLPSLDARDVVRALKRAGFTEDRQKGSHLVLIHPVTLVRTVVPVHSNRTLKRSLLFQILKDARLSYDEFQKLL